MKKIIFEKLNRKELSEKIALFVSKRSRIIFWKKTPKFFEGIAFHFREAGLPVMTLTNAESTIKLLDEKICLNVPFGEIEYFFQGKVIEHNELENLIRVEIFDECFKFDKRSRERCRVFPEYEIYAYLKYFIDNPRNVISFNKKDQSENNFFNKLHDQRLQKLADLSNDLSLQDEEDLVGFRVEDLSPEGLSFLASQKEKENILDRYLNTEFKLTINIETQVFTLNEAKIAYIMDYINSDFKNSSMFKVGVSFKYSPSLKRKLEELTGQSFDQMNYQNEFEEFINNE